MQTAPLFARAATLQIKLAGLLIVGEAECGAASLAKASLEDLERKAGRASAAVLSG
jgi:hypothetical protein